MRYLSNRSVRTLWLMTFWLILLAGPAFCEGVETLEATIKDVQGDVEVRFPDRIDWEPAKTGMKLRVGTDIRTGPFSNARLAFEDDSIAIIHPYSRLTINTFFKSQTAVVTRLSLRVGRITASISPEEEGKPSSDYEVATPTLVGSVRGTEIKSISAGALYGDRMEVGESGEMVVTKREGD